MLNGRWDGIDAIPSIQKNHFFETVDVDVLTFGLHSRVAITERHQFRVSDSSDSDSENEETEESENDEMETDQSENGEMETDESEKESTENIPILQESYYAVFFFIESLT